MAGNIPNSDFDPSKLAETVNDISEQYQSMLQDFISSQGQSDKLNMDPLGLNQAFLDFTASIVKNPEKLMEAQMEAWNAYTNLWFGAANKAMGQASEATIAPEKGDRRFKHEAWENNPFFDFIKQSYLVTANSVQSLVADAEGLDEKDAQKLRFYTQQFVDTLSPTNFALTNPQVLEATLESKGENLIKGLQNFCEDFDSENGKLRIKMTDQSAFELGKNVATSKGKVVFQNEMLQLIQYSPLTEEVNKRPLLIIPPWINKFYILDLQEKNSLIKYQVEQGHTVFVVSWVNPDEKHRDKDFEDYVLEGALAAVDAIEKATGEKEINAIGYCIGGTLLAATLAYMSAQEDKRIVSATFYVTLLDFSEPGDLGVFIDEQQIASLEEEMNERGYLDGSQMANSFNMLRSNDLIWSFYVNNYLLGKEPLPFDLLYWNSDSTRMPAKMHSTYLRKMYLENHFKEPGGMIVNDIPVDLRDIKTPSYFISTEEDHIAPWKSTLLGAQLLSGPVRFVLGKSGHIAGVVNPPAANKYGYLTGGKPNTDADSWHEKAKAHEGSWWKDWDKWIKKHAGEKVQARQPGEGSLKAIEDAPGSYVKVRA
ncbi:MAG: class I poly(R)-hydroxyalkanoic acid synthase [Gammaproteobacteria bacterium]|nr:class I poly(R)-hydroxyalkanoic acid synthase [Gammaproteobacteria bacterium]